MLIGQKFKVPGGREGTAPGQDRAVPPSSQKRLEFIPSPPLPFLLGEQPRSGRSLSIQSSRGGNKYGRVGSQPGWTRAQKLDPGLLTSGQRGLGRLPLLRSPRALCWVREE